MLERRLGLLPAGMYAVLRESAQGERASEPARRSVTQGKFTPSRVRSIVVSWNHGRRETDHCSRPRGVVVVQWMPYCVNRCGAPQMPLHGALFPATEAAVSKMPRCCVERSPESALGRVTTASTIGKVAAQDRQSIRLQRLHRSSTPC
jgi:hypothetical protein